VRNGVLSIGKEAPNPVARIRATRITVCENFDLVVCKVDADGVRLSNRSRGSLAILPLGISAGALIRSCR
jgi:hypothetical protein